MFFMNKTHRAMRRKRLLMNFKMVHENYNVADLDKSMAFYEKAHKLHEEMG